MLQRIHCCASTLKTTTENTDSNNNGITLQWADVINALKLRAELSNIEYEIREHQSLHTQIADKDYVHYCEVPLFDSFYNECGSGAIHKRQKFLHKDFLKK